MAFGGQLANTSQATESPLSGVNLVERTLGRRPGALGSHLSSAINLVSLDNSLSGSEADISCTTFRNISYISKTLPTS